MDLRGYSLPIQLGYPPFPQPHASETGSGPRVANEYQRDYAFGDLSLSDGPGPRDMPLRCGSSKDHMYKGGIWSPDGRHHKPKKHVPATRHPNPGIDVALRNLDHDVRTSLRISQAFVQDFDTQIKPLQEWAEDYTLDTIWRNIVRNKCRDKRDGERFGGMPERILRSRVSIKEAIGKAKTFKTTWDDQHGIERQIRTGKKALLYCDGIIDLAGRAGSERLACKQLVLELNEARCLLDRKRHPWICESTSVPVARSFTAPNRKTGLKT
ncbi:hypothetical protein BT67DRAFT_374151 [Trichocladium antarcticum]|uniref:Uncharacterized protein n=1 Tax=Trichocladium antarcticum TaxID=1450529 RepID=A0AAN6UPL4_9PEZI|nr:hypothetical protein BT67DRAFT_374151 [Trichocladium antarcticum]